jgi:hypothetical protein
MSRVQKTHQRLTFTQDDSTLPANYAIILLHQELQIHCLKLSAFLTTSFRLTRSRLHFAKYLFSYCLKLLAMSSPMGKILKIISGSKNKVLLQMRLIHGNGGTEVKGKPAFKTAKPLDPACFHVFSVVRLKENAACLLR